MPDFTIRTAKRSDLGALAALEERVFSSDRLSPRSFRRLSVSPGAALRVAAGEDGIAGYGLVFVRANSRIARLYSIAVHPERRGLGLARRLLADAERQARRRGCRALRLEVREDNPAAIRLYERAGYRPIGRVAGYYADGMAALRYEKDLGADAEEDRSPDDAGPISPYMSARRRGHRRPLHGRRIPLPISQPRQPACRLTASTDALPPRRHYRDRGL